MADEKKSDRKAREAVAPAEPKPTTPQPVNAGAVTVTVDGKAVQWNDLTTRPSE